MFEGITDWVDGVISDVADYFGDWGSSFGDWGGDWGGDFGTTVSDMGMSDSFGASDVMGGGMSEMGTFATDDAFPVGEFDANGLPSDVAVTDPFSGGFSFDVDPMGNPLTDGFGSDLVSPTSYDEMGNPIGGSSLLKDAAGAAGGSSSVLGTVGKSLLNATGKALTRSSSSSSGGGGSSASYSSNNISPPPNPTPPPIRRGDSSPAAVVMARNPLYPYTQALYGNSQDR